MRTGSAGTADATIRPAWVSPTFGPAFAYRPADHPVALEQIRWSRGRRRERGGRDRGLLHRPGARPAHAGPAAAYFDTGREAARHCDVGNSRRRARAGAPPRPLRAPPAGCTRCAALQDRRAHLFGRASSRQSRRTERNTLPLNSSKHFSGRSTPSSNRSSMRSKIVAEFAESDEVHRLPWPASSRAGPTAAERRDAATRPSSRPDRAWSPGGTGQSRGSGAGPARRAPSARPGRKHRPAARAVGRATTSCPSRTASSATSSRCGH
jgi:hypothetical protein